jgi:signal peptidase II
MTPREAGLAGALGALVLDQGSKLLLLYGLGLAHAPRDIAVLPFLDVTLTWNAGVSFSLFAVHSMAGVFALVAFKIVAIAAFGWWMWQAPRRLQAIGQGLVIGGALGNLLDRFTYGGVADFFDLHAFGQNFFVCNLADVAISVGVAALLYDTIFDVASSREVETR